MQFEYCVALLSKDLKLALKELRILFDKTSEYDHFFKHYAKLLLMSDNKKESIKAYEFYLSKYPADVEAWESVAKLYTTPSKIKKVSATIKRLGGKI